MLDLFSVVQNKAKGMSGKGAGFLLVAQFLRHHGLIG